MGPLAPLAIFGLVFGCWFFTVGLILWFWEQAAKEPRCTICRGDHLPEDDPFCRVVKWQYLNRYPGKKRSWIGRG